MVCKPSFALLCLPFFALAACGEEPDDAPVAERIAFAEVQRIANDPAPSPDTTDAVWTVTEDGQAIDFGLPEGEPLLSLSCSLRDDPPQIAIIRHIAARPGQQALFPVIGNGMISRFPLDAALENGEWRWQGALAASDPRLDVFTGTREVEATLPGGGTLLISGSSVPGEFIRWCRQGGRLQDALEQEVEEVEQL